MIITTKIKKNQSAQILNSLDPNSDHFNFELWTREVRQQMLTALQKRFSSSRAET